MYYNNIFINNIINKELNFSAHSCIPHPVCEVNI